MKFTSLIGIALITSLVAVATTPASACQCGASSHGKNSWEQTRVAADGALVIFEGTPEHFAVQWDVLTAREGDWVSAETHSPRPEPWPGMLVTFRVQRAYKGSTGAEIQIKTGMGGGDCGAVYDPGLTYLVFARGTNASDLRVSMCSPGGWIGSKGLAVALRYLRREPPVASDLVPAGPWSAKEYAAQEGQRKHDYDEFQKQYAKVTGKICGNVFAEKTKDGDTGMLSFLSTAGYSPADHPRAEINPDGSFCSGPLGPGKYFIFFTRGSDGVPTSAVYYPGVAEKGKATPINIGAGQTQSNLTFKIPVQKAYSVRGLISTNEKSGLDATNVNISLISLDGVPILASYHLPIDFQGSLPLPKVKYFDFENVLPGHYIAYVSVLGQGWTTRKEEVNVTTHMKFISLQLRHTK